MRAEPLSLADAVRYHMSTPWNPLEIGVLLLLSERMQAAELEALVEQRLLAHARLRQTVVHARFPFRPRWRAPERFAPAEHVAVYSGPPLSERELADHLSERFSRALSFARPPWSMELLPLADGTSALFFRVHHCVADGLSLVRLLCEIADEPRPAANGHAAVPSASRPREGAAPARSATDKLRELGATFLRTTASRVDPAQELHVATGKKRVAWTAPVALAPLSDAAQAHGCHVTELLLASAAAALAEGLRAGGRPVPDRVRVLVPTGASLGRRELGNRFASTFVEVGLAERDPWRRIEQMLASTGKLRDPAQAGFARALIGMAGWLSPPVMRRAMDFFSRRASLLMSNVPGPAQRVRLMGRAVRSVVVFAPASASIGLSFTVFGYAGTVRVGVETDAGVPLTPAKLADDFEQALRELSSSEVSA